MHYMIESKPQSGLGGRWDVAGTCVAGRLACCSPTRALVLQAQAVADTAHSVDERGLDHVDLVPQVADVGLEDARVARERVVPHVLEDLVAGEHTPGVGEEVMQQPVFGGRELD